jgi:hypothetical protein
MRRVPRIVLSGFAAVLAVAGLAGCRTSPAVAAYVGDDTITVDELQSAIDSRTQDATIAKFAESQGNVFTRQVLSLLVGEEVYADAAEHWDVTVSDAEVRDRIDTLLGSPDPDTVYGQLAEQGIGREDVFENVRQQLTRQKIAQAEGIDDPLSDAALQQQYQQNIDQYQQYVIGYIGVPDQATADAVLAQLTADPSSYPAVAAAFNNGVTLLQTEARPADQLPQVLASGLQASKPGTGFIQDVPDVGLVVAFLSEVSVQPFEQVRGDLEDAAASSVDDAATKLVTDFRDGLDITVNPRYGVLQENAIVEDKNGVVDILGGSSADSSSSSSSGGADPTGSGSTGG